MNSHGVTIQTKLLMKSIFKWYFSNLVLAFASLDEVLWCDYSKKTLQQYILTLLGTVHLVARPIFSVRG